jgi:hypothetical protein
VGQDGGVADHDAPPPRADASTADEARLAYANLIAYSRATTTWCRRGSFEDGEGILAYAGGSWIPVNCNGAFRTDESVPAAELVGRADTFFARRKRGYTVKVRESGEDADLQEACEAHGLVAFGDPIPQMICRRRLERTTPPADVCLREVRDEEGIADFAAVNTDAYATYGMPAEVFVDMFDRPGRILASTQTSIVVGYRGTRPVATALSFVSDGVACLQWVGTVADARHLSLGRFVTEWATNNAFERGATSVTLQASAMGEPLYARLGYETQYHYREYVRWEPPASSPMGSSRARESSRSSRAVTRA